mgnify:FL=1
MILVNGVASDVIDAHDRGLAYGDGVFRTFPMRGGRPAVWRRQYAKLAADCDNLRIACPSNAIIERDLALIAKKQPDCVVKIIVTRGGGQRGYALPAAAAPVRVVLSDPLPAYPPGYYEHGVRTHLCRLRLAPQPALAGIKHLNRLENVIARAEWSDPEIAEGLLCDIEDNVIGGTMSNLFALKDGVLVTPDLTRCGVAGVTRERVIEIARENKIDTRIAAISIDELLAADELFVTNSVIGVWQIAALDRRTWVSGTLTLQVRRWLEHAQDR